MPSERFTVRLTRDAEKDRKALRGDIAKLSRAINALEAEPYRGHPLRGKLRGARALEFSLPSGEHRAAYYVVTEDLVCLVFAIGHHEGFYAEAERRAAALRRSGQI